MFRVGTVERGSPHTHTDGLRVRKSRGLLGMDGTATPTTTRARGSRSEIVVHTLVQLVPATDELCASESDLSVAGPLVRDHYRRQVVEFLRVCRGQVSFNLKKCPESRASCIGRRNICIRAHAEG